MEDRLNKRMDDLNDKFKSHAKEDKEALKSIHGTLEVMKNNHLHHIEIDMATMKADMTWVKKALWGVGGATVASLISSLIKLL